MKQSIVAVLAGLWMVAGLACRQERPARSEEITVFAAASLAGVLDDVAERFQKDTGLPVRISYASSSTLARQIEAGAACDVFVSAHAGWLTYLRERRLITGDSHRVAGNRLVLIAPRGSAFQVQMRPEFALAEAFQGRLALGNPEHVPGGVYARQALVALGWWDGLRDRLAPCADVRAALRAVETGQADAGIVYATDAAASGRVEVVGVFPDDTHEPIGYSAAVCQGTRPPARQFLEFLLTRASQEVFERHGFSSPPQDTAPAE